MRERRWLIAAIGPLVAYEYVALRRRNIPTITTCVRTTPRWVKVVLGGCLAIGYSHLFLGRP